MHLYHASHIKHLTCIEPQRTLSHDKYIGDYVFATKNKTLAFMYLAVKGFPTLMSAVGDKPNIVICGSADEYLEQDAGGAIYELSPETFMDTPQEGLELYEMVSRSAVESLDSVTYSRTLEAMIGAGIQVHFVNQEVFWELVENPRQAERIEQLTPYSLR